MNARIALSSIMNLKHASEAINTLPADARLHFKVKTDGNGIKIFCIRPLSNVKNLKLKLTGGYSANQKTAAYNLIRDIVKRDYPDLNQLGAANRSNPEIKNMLKLKGAIQFGVSLSMVEAGFKVKPSLSRRINDQIFKLQSDIAPSTLGKGLD